MDVYEKHKRFSVLKCGKGMLLITKMQTPDGPLGIRGGTSYLSFQESLIIIAAPPVYLTIPCDFINKVRSSLEPCLLYNGLNSGVTL